MKKTIFLVVLFVASILQAQNPETNSNNWQVTKLRNTDQLVNKPNEITYGPNGKLWITERAPRSGNGGFRVVAIDPTNNNSSNDVVMLDLKTISGLNAFSNAGQDGLMGMAVHPDLYTDITTTTNNYVYIAYTYGTGNADRKLRIERYTYDNTTETLDPNSGFTLIENIEASNDHNSGRMKIGPDGMIYYTVGDLGWNQFANKCKRIQSQRLPSQSEVNSEDWYAYKGKILRMTLTGDIPADNPYFAPFVPTDNAPGPPDNTVAQSQKVQSHIYTFGHRNAQGIIFGSNGKLYSSEHGDRVDDEVNIITPGKNYGWPLAVGEYDDAGYSYCIKASDPNGCSSSDGNSCPSGSIIHDETDFPTPADFQGPIATYNSTVSSVPQGGFLTWPTVAPSSIDIYEPQGLPGEIPWSTSLIVPTLKKGTLYRYELDAAGNTVTSDLIEFHSSIDRYRDVAISPDGTTIYAITDSSGNTSGPTGSSSLSLQNPGAVIVIKYVSQPEPSNQPTNFAAVAQNGTINLDWNDATGTNIPSGYVITASNDAALLPAMIDGNVIDEDSDLTDGIATVYVEAGVEEYSFAGLTQGETYYFQIHSFSNLGSDIDYLISPVGPTADDLIPPFPTLYISEITNTGGNNDSNYVEIFNYGTQAIDLGASGISLARQAAGNPPTNRNEFLSGTIQPGEYLIIGRSTFNTEYAPLTTDLVAANNVLGGTGDDPYLLVYNGDFTTATYEVIDIFGELGVDGDFEAWNYEDSRAVRKRNTTSNSSIWVESQWDIIASSNIADNTPGEPDLISFTYDNQWLPYNPSGITVKGDNATIISGTAVFTDHTQLGELTVQTGQTVDFSNNNISIAGDLINNGVLTADFGKVILNGDANQVISGNDFTIAEIEIDNDVDVNVNLEVTRVLTSTSGTMSVNPLNAITLKSTATGTAFIDEVNGVLNGEFMTERYVMGKRTFRFVTPSVTTTTSIYDNWQEGGINVPGLGTHITGSSTGANGFDQTASGNASIFGFDNTTQAWTVPANTDNTTLVAGTPYRLFVRGDRSVDLTNNNSTPVLTVLRAQGTIVTGNQQATNLSNVAGQFNFIGNPYQAPVDLSTVLASSTNVGTNFVYFWDPNINARGAYVTVDVPLNSTNITSDFNKYAQPHSSFFVTTLAAGAATVDFQESDKEISQEALNVFSTPNNDPRISIQLFESTEFSSGLRERDAAVLTLSPTASNLVNHQDAVKFYNLDENIAIANQNAVLSIEKRQSIQDGDVVALFTNNYRASQYELKIDMTGIITPAYLYDTYLNTYTALATSGATVYSFSIDSNVAASTALDRFRIDFSNTTLSNSELTQNSFTVYPNPTADKVINIAGINGNDLDIQLFNLLGQEILIPSGSISTNGTNTQIALPQSVNRGTYLLTISSDSNRVTEKIVVE